MFTASPNSRRIVSWSSSLIRQRYRGHGLRKPAFPGGGRPGGYRLRMTTEEWGLDRTAAVRGETREQVLDRNVAELLQELRVVLTGVQILFAFLLTLPFTARFGDLGGRSQ